MSGSGTLLDTETPNAAKAYDHLLRGDRDSVEALRPTREMVEEIAALYPPGVPGARDLAIASCLYQQRAVRDAAGAGSRQFLVLGSGYPWPHLELRGAEQLRPLHEVAREDYPDARMVYVDWDLLAVLHGRNAVRDVRGVSYAHRDLTDVAGVKACPEVTGTVMDTLIDWGRPVTVVLGLVLHFWPADKARKIIEGYLEVLRPGSRIVVTVASWEDAALLGRVRAVFAPAELHSHSKMQIQAILRGMSLPAGKVEVAHGPGEVVGRKVPACVLGAVGEV